MITALSSIWIDWLTSPAAEYALARLRKMAGNRRLNRYTSANAADAYA